MQPPWSHIPPEVVALADYEAAARARLSEGTWAWLSGGSEDEKTLGENRESLARLRLRPRILGSFPDGGHTRVTLLGRTLPHPVLLAPVAFHRLVHPDGELATALGAAATGTPLVVSTQASVSLEDIARASGAAPRWFQLYIQPDRGVTTELIRRAEAAGYEALVVTADAPVGGLRNRERRANFQPPPEIEAANLRNLPPPRIPPGGGLCGGLLRVAPTWTDLDWLRTTTRLPLVLKGVLDPADAVRAVEAGVDALAVSNHGGRTLDTAPATIDALPRVAEATGGRVPLLLDGGVCRGTDIVKALALGATAVMIGRPYLHGLAAAGAIGVAHVVRILCAELEVALALTGRSNPAAVDRSVLWDAGLRRNGSGS